MTVERLHFEPGRMGYEWRLAAEHVVRYAFAATLCRGRRVLDVACGEGYGTYMLAQGGASAVVGVDVAADAVAMARTRFSAAGVRYLVGDATELPAVLSAEAPFDLVVSFETIEHVADVERFLAGIRAVLAPDGVVVISAPNEPGPSGHDSANPFHRQTFTFDQLRALVERHLGAARRWYFGTPLQGMVVAEAGSPALLNDRSELSLILEGSPCGGAVLLPAQRELQVGESGCTFFMGVWGADGDPVIAGSPLSVPGLLEPWKAIEWFRAENARLLRELDATAAVASPGADAHERMLAESVADLRRASLLDRARLERAEATMRKMAFEHERLARTETQLRAEVARLEADTTRLAAENAAIGARLHAIEGSHGWRLVQMYARLLAHPVAGWPLRRVRRLLHRA
jgi:SAM-dependent methyltransferase